MSPHRIEALGGSLTGGSPPGRTCSGCDAVNADLTLSDRVFTCGCGLVLDRAVNAATNLARWTPAPSVDPSTAPPRPVAA